MHILDYYRDIKQHGELKQILTLGSQKHEGGLPDFFLEKDLWVTEILRLLYDERLLGEHAVAFKGGTALSKCWKVIDRFSEDIDLSIHWADLADAEDEVAAWEQSTSSGSQIKKFRQRQSDRLIAWSEQFVERLNLRLGEYGIEGLGAELEAESHGEKVNVHFPRMVNGDNNYHLDYVLLEFGGRNRGQPTETHTIESYLADIPELQEITYPKATVKAYDPSYIMWEKLTALHQYSTMEREPNAYRLARHWYDVDCMLQERVVDLSRANQARNDVVEMKKQRWAEKGVDYELVLQGGLKLVPDAKRLVDIAADHKAAILGRMFFNHRMPDDFDKIVGRILRAQDSINITALNNYYR